MKAIHILRKPCSESTVAANVLRWGTGALNIDACRVGVTADEPNLRDPTGHQRTTGSIWGNAHGAPKDFGKNGRWPANLVLQHLDGCEQTGTREEAGYSVNRFTDGAKPFGGGAGHPYESEQVPPSTVPVWACAEGCPVAALDAQSGITKSAVALEVKTSRVKGQFVVNATSIPGANQHGDTGGASRYFKQFIGKVTGEE